MAFVGLKKKGDGSLTLSGNNTFAGTSVVEDGESVLTGSVASSVTVNGGTFSLDGGAVNGTVAVSSGDSFSINGNSVIDGDITGAGISLRIGRTELGLFYEGRFKNRYTDYTGMFNLKLSF